MYKVGELFAGIGGIGLAFKNAGYELIWANEIDEKACYTYSKNFNHKMINYDMKKIQPSSFEKIDILTGGFPCQAFSIAGYRKGFEDERGNLFFDILHYLEELSPQVVFLENVKNLLSHNNGDTFKIIIKKLNEQKYFVKYQILNTCEYSDIPQNRERLYIVCFKNKKAYDKFSFPKKISKTKQITAFLEDKVDASYYYLNSKLYNVLKETIVRTDTFYQWRRKYVRENKNNLCPTLTANMGTGGHNIPLLLDKNGIRKLTPRECARFQGFPDNFILPNSLSNSALYKQIGNSVSVPVIQSIAQNIILALNS